MFDFSKINNNTFTKFIGVLLLVFFYSNLAYSFQYLPKDKYLDSKISETKFDKKVWKNTTSGIDYSGQTPTEKKEKKETERTRTSSGSGGADYDDDRTYSSETYSGSRGSNNFWSGFFKFFLIALGVIVIAFIIANMVGAEGWALAPNRQKAVAQKSVPITLENVEENIYESDLDRFIREALEKENYSQAVRLYYLAIIKELSLKKWIRWKKDKTNRDYIRELTGTNFQNGFRNVTRMFERVWYGKEKIDGGDFHSSVQPQMKDLLQDSQKSSKKI